MISVNKKYIPLFNGDTRYYIILGGRGSGKSFALSSFACGLSFEEKQRILYTRQTMTSAHLSIIPEFQEKIEIMGADDRFVINKTEIINKDSGSDILFKGIQSSSGTNTANLKSLNAITTWILDEAEELVDETIFDKINLSIRTKGVQNRVILVMNPTTKESWIYKRFFEDRGINQMFNGVVGDTTYIHTDYRDNIKNLDESFLAQIEDIRINKPKKYQHVILGAWLDKSEGVIFENWRTGEFVDTGYTMYGSDWGFSNDPTTLVKVSVDSSRMRIYLKQELYKTKLTTNDIAKILIAVCGDKKIVADSAEPRLITELKGKGLNIKGAIKGAGSVKEGIAVLLNYELIIDPESIDLIKELNNYAWSDKKSETPIDKFNHCFIGSTPVLTNKGYIDIKSIKKGDFVITPDGSKEVLIKWDNGIKQVNKYLMQFDTFSLYLCCTNNHLIKTSRGWIEIENLKSNETIYLDRNIMELNTDYIQEKDITQEDQKECTLSYGKSKIIKKSQKDSMYIIRMKTRGITMGRILRLKKVESILLNTVKKDIKKIQNGQKRFIQKGFNVLKNGTQVKTAKNGTVNTLLNHGNHVSLLKKNARFAVKNTQQDILVNQDFVIKTAKLLRLGVEENWEETVYDLTVADEHCYIANGVLVHNCLDAVRYACSELLVPVRNISFGDDD